MGSALYKDCLLLWDARHDTESDEWIPVANISWKIGGQQHFHRVQGRPQDSKEAALQLARQLALRWVDKQL
jgi:hypothetical protein